MLDNNTIMNDSLGEVYLDSLDLTTGILKGNLEQNGLIDSDNDGLLDSEEINWNYVKVSDGQSIAVTFGELLDKLKDTDRSIFERYMNILSKKNVVEAYSKTNSILSETRIASTVNTDMLLSTKILVANPSTGTSALKRDSDKDGYIDCDDPHSYPDNVKFMDGVTCYLRNTWTTEYFGMDESNDYLVNNNKDYQIFHFKWEGNGYRITLNDNHNKYLTFTDTQFATFEEYTGNDNQLWQIIPRKDERGCMLKCLSPNNNTRGGVYINSKDSYNYTKLSVESYSDSMVAYEIYDWITYEEAIESINNNTENITVQQAYKRYNFNKEALKNYNLEILNDSMSKNKIFVTGKTLINGQGLPPYCNMKFGLFNFGDKGCGAIATYNALILNGEYTDFLKLVFEFDVNALIVAGTFGVDPAYMEGYFKSHDIVCGQTKSISEVSNEIKNGKIAILLAWNGDYLWEGAHYVTVKYNNTNSITVYNMYSNRGNEYSYVSVEELMNYFGSAIKAYLL